MRWITALCLVISLSTHAQGNPAGQILQEWDNTVLAPAYRKLDQQASTLAQRTQQACLAPSPQKLVRLRSSWLAATLSWRQLELLPAGPTLQSRANRNLDFHPVRESLLMESIRTQGFNPDSAALGGFSTIEWLLYPDGQGKSLSPAQRCTLLTHATRQLQQTTQSLNLAWSTHATRNWPQDAANAEWADRLNLLLASITQLNKQLEKAETSPLYGTLSETRRKQLLAQFEGLSHLWQGNKPADTGFSRLLDNRDHPVVDRQIREAIAAIQLAAGTTREAQLPQTLAPLLRDLLKRLERDVAEALQIGIGFNDADGD